jgi:putative heme-binding domain-containing protein
MKPLTVLRLVLLALVAALAGGRSAQGADKVDAQWVWADEGGRASGESAGTAWFRCEVRAKEPSTGAMLVVSSGPFAAYANGVKLGEGEGGKVYRFSLNGIVERGMNIVALQVRNDAGPAGLLVEGEVRGQGGGTLPFDTGKEWMATRTRPEGDAWLAPQFSPKGWAPVAVIGPHETSPWKEIDVESAEIDRFQLAPGFQLAQIAPPELSGSLVAMSWGPRGRLIVSRERGPIVFLIDDNQDGSFDRAVEYSQEMKNCQGLCQVADDLYAVGEGPQGTGLYRLPDADHDDRADTVVPLYKPKGGMGEHGPHDVVLGPDGWLYMNLGNHAWVTTPPEATSPIRTTDEGELLRPRFEDPHGHAAGIPAPGGTIWRFSPDAKRWWLVTNGFRNHYDFAFNSAGEAYTFDSDMEWEVGMPFYKPVRVAHCIPGAEFGWRSNSAKWPAYYLDSLPAACDVGRGSPTGVVFYEHRQFPEPYRGSFLACDWSMGRILSVRLNPAGATASGSYVTFASGNPLNVSDIEVDRDGSVVFCTGGRNTEGGVYRITYPSGDPARSDTPPQTVAELLKMPHMQSAWAREAAGEVRRLAGAAWEKELVEAARRGAAAEQVRALTVLAQIGPAPPADLLAETAADDEPPVRAFALWLLGDHPSGRTAEVLARSLSDPHPLVQRRACEAYVRSGLEPPVGAAWELLASPDRFVRYAARLAVERIPADKWRERALQSDNPRQAALGLLALLRVAPESVDLERFLIRERALIEGCLKSGDDSGLIDMIRVAERTMIAGGRDATAQAIGRALLADFPRGGRPTDTLDQRALDQETARIACFLQLPEAPRRLIDALAATTDRQLAIHYAMCLAYQKTGWDTPLALRLLDWYESTRDWEGGHSFREYVEQFVATAIGHGSADDRRNILLDWKKRPLATALVLRESRPDQVAGFEEVMGAILSGIDQEPEAVTSQPLTSMVIDALAKSSSEESKDQLRSLFDSLPDRREEIARVLAREPSAENWRPLVQSLRFGNRTTLQLAIRTLRQIPVMPDGPEPIRDLIIAGLKLKEEGAAGAVALLAQWTGATPPADARGAAGVAWFREWYVRQYPDQPPPELAEAGTDLPFTYEQLLEFVERSPEGKQGDPSRGRLTFIKANCARCHKFGPEGQGVGPDLTTLRRRFQRKEIAESLVFPSQVISDQYRSVVVTTVDGLVHTGMEVPQPDKESVSLLQSDATRIDVPRREIAELVPARVSVMPENVLKDLSWTEIADLFAYLETSKNAEAP